MGATVRRGNPAAAVWLGFGISIAAQNCNSLNVVSSIKNQDLKISALCGYNADIVLLSDVRLNGRERIITDKLRMSYTMYLNSSSNKRGVAVLFRNSPGLRDPGAGSGPTGKCFLA
jgi:hypothetical protein